MTKRDEILDFIKQFGEENKFSMPILAKQADSRGLALFSVFCWHLSKNCKVKDLKFNEFLTTLAEVNING